MRKRDGKGRFLNEGKNTPEYKKEYRKQYWSKYLTENREKLKVYHKKWYKKNKKDLKKGRMLYYQKNKFKMLLYNKNYYRKNKKRISEICSKWRKDNKELMNQYRKNWQKNNRRKINYQRKLRANNDLNYKLKEILRHRIYLALKLKKIPKSIKTEKLLGCNLLFFRKYILSKFKEGMNWNNYGKWHIDHIIPCYKFDLTNDKEQKKCFHYTNMQPLWASENYKKN